jgi:hypothetical protein
MKRLIALALACAVVPLAGATLYKYVDKDGKTVYSDTPPPGGTATQVTVHGGEAAPPKSFVERDKEAEKLRKAEAEKEKKAEQSAERAKAMAQRCEQAQANYRAYEQGGRLMKYDDKGERQYMTDEEIDKARADSKRQMEEACKPS